MKSFIGCYSLPRVIEISLNEITPCSLASYLRFLWTVYGVLGLNAHCALFAVSNPPEVGLDGPGPTHVAAEACIRLHILRLRKGLPCGTLCLGCAQELRMLVQNLFRGHYAYETICQVRHLRRLTTHLSLARPSLESTCTLPSWQRGTTPYARTNMSILLGHFGV